ncbi:MAG: transposase [Bacteroidetes bacterium]|nr:transposase [Bacteroidota bacterium]MBL7103132.1 transposase [Bacteroidales bacterium]
MSRKYKFRNPDGIYFVTYSVVRWIDVFTRNIYRNILLDSFIYCQRKKGLKIHAYVIMTNHVHIIISAEEGFYLENIMRDLKKFTSTEIIKTIKTNSLESRKEWLLKAFEEEGKKNSNNTMFQFWQQDNHPIELINNKMIDQKLEYLHNNPVEAGFVENPEDYIFTSARDYSGIKGLIDIEIIE